MQYPSAFVKNQRGRLLLRPEYRGISDILNGLSGGTVSYGYGHKKEYWEIDGMLESEAWAQFGRTYYENDRNAVKMFRDIFPHFTKTAEKKLKGLE